MEKGPVNRPLAAPSNLVLLSATAILICTVWFTLIGLVGKEYRKVQLL